MREKRKRSAFTPDSDSMFCDVRFSVFGFHVLHSQLSFFGTFYFDGLVKLFLSVTRRCCLRGARDANLSQLQSALSHAEQ